MSAVGYAVRRVVGASSCRFNELLVLFRLSAAESTRVLALTQSAYDAMTQLARELWLPWESRESHWLESNLHRVVGIHQKQELATYDTVSRGMRWLLATVVVNYYLLHLLTTY